MWTGRCPVKRLQLHYTLTGMGLQGPKLENKPLGREKVTYVV